MHHTNEEVLKAYKDTHADIYLEALIYRNKPLAIKIYARTGLSRDYFPDFLQEYAAKVIVCANTFKISRGWQFSTYLARTISSLIARLVKDEIIPTGNKMLRLTDPDNLANEERIQKNIIRAISVPDYATKYDTSESGRQVVSYILSKLNNLSASIIGQSFGLQGYQYKSLQRQAKESKMHYKTIWKQQQTILAMLARNPHIQKVCQTLIQSKET